MVKPTGSCARRVQYGVMYSASKTTLSCRQRRRCTGNQAVVVGRQECSRTVTENNDCSSANPSPPSSSSWFDHPVAPARVKSGCTVAPRRGRARPKDIHTLTLLSVMFPSFRQCLSWSGAAIWKPFPGRTPTSSIVCAVSAWRKQRCDEPMMIPHPRVQAAGGYGSRVLLLLTHLFAENPR